MQVSEMPPGILSPMLLERLNRVAANHKLNEHMDAVGRVPGQGKAGDISQRVK